MHEESSCQLLGKIAIIISTKYIKTEYWSGQTYNLSIAQMFEPIEISEQEIELFESVP